MDSAPAHETDEELLPTRASLLARLKRQDDSPAWQRGWEEFHALYFPLIFRYARKRGLAIEDAEEVVQDVVLGVARRIPEFTYDPGRGSFKTWLFRVCRNKVVDRMRRLQKAARGPLVSASEAVALDEVADPAVLAPDRAWDLAWETSLRRAAQEHVAQRVKPMTMRLYLYHVVDGHDAATTVAHFADPKVTSEAVHLARHRVQKMLDTTLARLQEGETPG
ncbi:MAG: RNA polymerase sigma factor [Limisphaerales bacterium]